MTFSKEIQAPYSFKELAAFSEVSAEAISHTHKKHFFDNASERLKFTLPSHIVLRFCAKTNIERQHAANILKEVLEAEKHTCWSQSAATVAGAKIYRYCLKHDIKISLEKISEVNGVSTSTLRRFLKANKTTS